MRSRTRAFTIVELILAMVIVSVIALSVAGISAALSSAYAHSQDYYQCIQGGRVGMRRIQKPLRKARLITACTADSLGFWGEDSNDDGIINLDEIRLISYDSVNRQVTQRRIRFPDGMDPGTKDALNVEIALHELTDISNVANYLTGMYLETTPMAVQVDDFEVAPQVAPPMTRFLKVVLNVSEGGKEMTVRSAVSLRVDMTSHVEFSDGEYVLE